MENLKLNVRHIGFTLIELMIVVSIISIIAFVAIPNYQNHICKTQRQNVKMDLLAYAQAMDQFYTTNNFSFQMNSGNAPSVHPNHSPADADVSKKYFDITLTVLDSETYSLSSSRSAGSCNDGVMTLTNTGAKSWVINGSTKSNWNE